MPTAGARATMLTTSLRLPTRDAARRAAAAGYAVTMFAAWLLLDRPSGGTLETMFAVALELALPLSLMVLLEAALGAAARVHVSGPRG